MRDGVTYRKMKDGGQPILRSGVPSQDEELDAETLPYDAPERKLLRGVLESGLHDAKSESAVIRGAALAWFASHSREWLYAFESVCERLGLEPDWIRRRVGVARQLPKRSHYLMPPQSTRRIGSR